MGACLSRQEFTQKLSNAKKVPPKEPVAQKQNDGAASEEDEDPNPNVSNLDERVKMKLKPGNCEDYYDIGDVIGKGGFATVRQAVEKDTQEKVAIKIMEVTPKEKSGKNDNTWADVLAEISILCHLDHPNIISLREFFIHSNKVYLITNLVRGGELLESVLKCGAYTEATAQSCFRQILEGVKYCHNLKVVHRDLKLENLLLETEGDLTKILIVDFGLAKGHFSTPAIAMETVCGTPHYVAPEVLMGGQGKVYGPEVDLWGCGVILFVLLSGNPPFYADQDRALYDLIKAGAYSFQDPIWDFISDQAKDLIQKLLVTEPSNRFSAAQALEHPWITENRSEAPLAGALDNLRATMHRD